VTAAYNGLNLQSGQELHFHVEGDWPITITLTNQPPQGSGTVGDPYVVDRQTDYVFSAVHDTEGDVTERVWFYDDPDGYYRRPGTDEYIIDFWNCNSGTCAIYTQGSYDLNYDLSNRLYFRLPVVGYSGAGLHRLRCKGRAREPADGPGHRLVLCH
jgi:hypothetical protein